MLKTINIIMNKKLMQYFMDKVMIKSLFNTVVFTLLCFTTSAWALPGDMLWSSDIGGNIGSSPAIDNTSGRIYLGSADRNVYAYDSAGNRLWAFFSSGHVGSAPTISEDGSTVYVGSHDGIVYALNAATGKQRWRFATGGAIFSSPALGEDGKIYVGSDDNSVYAIDPVLGLELWHYETGGSIGSSPAISHDGIVYVGSADGKLYALDSEATDSASRLKWSFMSDGVQGMYSPAIGSDGIVYVGAFDYTFYALNPNGLDANRVKWSLTLGGRVASAPAIGNDGLLYIASFDDGMLHAIQITDGTIHWSFPTASQIYSSPAIVADGTVIFGALNNTVYSLDPALYNPLAFVPADLIKWSFAADTPLVSSPVIASNGSVVISSVQTLFSIEDNSGGLSDTAAWPMFGLDAKHTARTVLTFVPLNVVDDNVSINVDANSSVDIDVLSNDSGTNISISNVGVAANGVAELSVDGLSVVYTPATNFTGQDSFTYTATNDVDSLQSSINVKVSSNLDTDADGILDSWELANFGGLTFDGLLDSDGDGVSDYQEFLNGTDPNLLPPAVPGDVTVFAGNAQATFNWTDTAGSLSYRIYWSNTPGVTSATGTLIDSITTNPFVQTGLTNGDAYYYVITSVGAGGESATSVEVSVTPNSFNWGAPALVENNAGFAGDVQIASDANGNSIATWVQSDGIHTNVWANVYTASSGWGVAQLIEFDDTADASNPQVSMDSVGNATVLWQQTDGVSESLWSNSYSWNSTSWGTPTQIINTSIGSLGEASIVHHDSGSIVAVWSQDLSPITGVADAVFASQLDANNIWLLPTQIDGASGTITEVLNLHLLAESNGDTLAIWVQSQDGGATYEIAYNRYTSAGWGTVQILRSGMFASSLIGGINLDIAVNASGEIVLVWTEGTNPTSIWTAKYSSGVWLTPELLVTDSTSSVAELSVAINDNGSAVASWIQSDGTRDVVNVLQHQTGSTSWETIPTQISSTSTANYIGNTAVQDIAIDFVGNVLVTWQQSDGTLSNIWANYFDTATNAWESAQIIETDNSGNATNPQVTINFDGSAIVTWQQSNGTEDSIWFNQLASGVTSIPNILPVINAGDTNIIADEQSVVTIDASATYDQDGTIATFLWEHVSGTTLTLTGANTNTVTFTTPVLSLQEIVVLRLTVTDDQGFTNSSDFTVTINPVNNPPVVEASVDITVSANTEVFLTGTATDPDADGGIVSTVWTQIAGDPVTINFADSLLASFIAPVVSQDTVLSFQLNVLDNEGGAATATTNITVSGAIKDSDGDGLDDAWEITYFGSLIHDGSGDFDNDGISNLQEFIQGTLPDAITFYAPQSIIAIPQNGQVEIRWASVRSATGYNIYWSNSSGVNRENSTKISNITFPFVHTGLSNGNTYYYLVTALSEGDESADSVEVFVAPGSYNWGAAQITTDTNSNSIAAWVQAEATSTNIWAHVYRADTGWNVPQLIDFDNTADASDPQASLDTFGNATVLWKQTNGVTDSLWSNRYNIGSSASWGIPAQVTSMDVGSLFITRYTYLQSGTIVAAWTQDSSPVPGNMIPNAIWASELGVDNTWSLPVQIDGASGLIDRVISFSIGALSNGGIKANWLHLQDNEITWWKGISIYNDTEWSTPSLTFLW